MIRETVVVGVDQSVQSSAALQWAVRYARRTGASLRVVSVHPPWRPTLPYAVGVAGIPLLNQEGQEALAHAAITDLFNSARPESHWTLSQVEGIPGRELVKAARDANLLVVGTREHVGFDRFLEGSVSHYCLRHTKIPVVVVPASPDRVTVTEQPVESFVTDPATS